MIYGYYDWCLYLESAQPEYTQLTWQEKQEMIWSQIKADSSLGGYYPTDLITESVVTSFDNEWDFHPAGRRKVIHGNGAICKFDVDVSADSPFSGLLKAGSKISGLIRMGPATDPYSVTSSGMAPGVSIKFLRTGTMSANFLLLNNLNPLPDNSFNFFQVPKFNQLTADIQTPDLILLGQKFCATGHCITKVGISNVCTHDQDGNEAEELNFPFKFTFTPADISFPAEAPANQQAFMDQFKAIPVGSRLYTIRGHTSPEDTEGLVLGDVVTSSECLTSLYGDTKLAFKHQWIEDDVALKPEWSEAYFKDCYCNAP